MRLSTASVVVSLAALAGPGVAGPSTGFRIGPAGAGTPPHVVCATKLPVGLPGLYCASPVIRKGAYDGRGIVRLRLGGHAAVVTAGNDLLLAIDGSANRSRRPALAPGRNWSVGGYHCRNSDAKVVTCRSSRHGFTIGSRLKMF